MSQNHVSIARFGSRLETVHYSKKLILGRAPVIFTRRKRSKLTYKTQPNVWRVQKRIRQYILTLTHLLGSPDFATFTYTTKEFDADKAIEDWRLFTRRLKRKYPDVAIVRVPERHKDRGVHFHAAIYGLPPELACKMKKIGKKYIHACPKERKCERKLRDMAHCWNRGFVDLQKTRRPESIGAYIAKYLTKGNPDWSLFGKHIATFNEVFKRRIREARKAGILWNLSTYSSPVAVDTILDDHLPRCQMRSERTFETRWLGQAIHRAYDIESN